jgi:hypothetical protein
MSIIPNNGPNEVAVCDEVSVGWWARRCNYLSLISK